VRFASPLSLVAITFFLWALEQIGLQTAHVAVTSFGSNEMCGPAYHAFQQAWNV
jgi:hypothetical protein